MENKKISASAIVIVILSILLILTTGYIVYQATTDSSNNSVNDNNNTTNEKEEDRKEDKEEELSLQNEKVKELYERTQYGYFNCGGEPYFLKYDIKVDDKLLVENLSDSDKINLVTNNIDGGIDDDSGTPRVYLPEQQILEGMERIFGPQYTFDKTKTKGNMGCAQFEYKSEIDKYEAFWSCSSSGPCGPSGKHVLTELYKAKQGTDYIELYQLLAYDEVTEVIEPEHDWLKKIYKDEERKQLVDDKFEDFESLSKYAEQLPQYKYTFKKDATAGNYYFYSIERVN